MNLDKIIIKGAREHNLKNIDLEIPKNSFFSKPIPCSAETEPLNFLKGSYTHSSILRIEFTSPDPTAVMICKFPSAKCPKTIQ